MAFFDSSSRGFCSDCGESLGFSKLGTREYFCYKCENYVMLPKEACIQFCNQELENLRISFRELILEGDARRYLRNYLNVMETIFVTNANESSPNIDLNLKIELLPFNQDFFITMNLAVKWILEDLNYKYKSSNDFSIDKASNIMTQWYMKFQQKIYLENDLGVFIKRKDGNERKFYYYQVLDFYKDSLNEYATFHKGELSPENYYEKIAEFFEKRKNPENLVEFVKYDFPLTYICSLYNSYPNKKDRMFSFNDINAGYDVANILKKIIDKYNEKRSLNFSELNQPDKNFFAITNLEQLLNEFKDISWSPKILYYMFVTSQNNPMSFPLLIEFGNEIYISPTRLKIALKLMQQNLIHNHESNFLSRNFEIDFQEKILNLLKNKNVNVVDPITNLELINIKDKKNSTFEIDIFGYDEKNIYIIECKSFHPHPFYMLRENKANRKSNLERFKTQYFEKITPWLNNQLNNKILNGYIPIQCYKEEIETKNGRHFQFSLPERFKDSSTKNIIPLYITQLNESFPEIKDIYQIYYKEIE